MDQPKNKWKNVRHMISIPVIVLALLFIFFGGGVKVVTGEDSFTAKGVMAGSVTVLYKDIQSVELIHKIDFGRRTFGVGTQKTSAGSFKNAEYGVYKLYAYNKVNTYVVVRHTGGILVCNLDSAEKTVDLFEFIQDKLNG